MTMSAVDALKRMRAQSWQGKLSDEPALQDVSIPDAMAVYGAGKLAAGGVDALAQALAPQGILRNEAGAIFPNTPYLRGRPQMTQSWMSPVQKALVNSGMSHNSMLRGLMSQTPEEGNAAWNFLSSVRDKYPTPVGDALMKAILSKFGTP
jgi:hypothetical protein